jgi:hypothetical protein
MPVSTVLSRTIISTRAISIMITIMKNYGIRKGGDYGMRFR